MIDLIIIGAGAAGLFCAGTAAARGQSVLVLEHGPEAGRKILISGGGRCNFTNRKVGAENFLSGNPHFAKSALAGFTPADFIGLVEEAGIAYHEKTLGQLFCDDSAQQILDLLLKRAAGAKLLLNTRVTDISHHGAFTVHTDRGAFTAPRVVIASGGLSIPKLGATPFAYEMAKRFGHALVQPRPALVPLTFGPQDTAWMTPLSGVSLPVVAKAGKRAFAENLLFTHRGLSGPAVLQVSSYLKPGEGFTADLCPGTTLADLLVATKISRPRAELKTVLATLLPARLAAHFGGGDTRIMAEWQDKPLRTLGERLNRFPFTPMGSEGFAKAEVTVGGVDTDGLNSKTCESRSVPGLFFIGEAVDVTGWLGGYNFQWAWASGHAAGLAT